MDVVVPVWSICPGTIIPHGHVHNKLHASCSVSNALSVCLSKAITRKVVCAGEGAYTILKVTILACRGMCRSWRASRTGKVDPRGAVFSLALRCWMALLKRATETHLHLVGMHAGLFDWGLIYLVAAFFPGVQLSSNMTVQVPVCVS